MTFSSNPDLRDSAVYPDKDGTHPKIERGLDAMIIVYSLLDNHPASNVCERFIRTRPGWFTTTLTLFEVKAILTKVYAVDTLFASRKIEMFVAGPIVVVEVDLATAITAMKLADALRIDMTDAVLLHTSQAIGAPFLATDDKKLAQACRQVGMVADRRRKSSTITPIILTNGASFSRNARFILQMRIGLR